MGSILSTFHVETNLLLAQLVNFIIVLLVLYKFAYHPILKKLNERTGKIEKGLKDAKEAQDKLIHMEEKERETLAEARKEARQIIDQAQEIARKNKEEITAEARTQSEKVIAEAQKKIEEERVKLMAEVKAEMADLVVAATGKLIAEKIDAAKDKELIEKAIK